MKVFCDTNIIFSYAYSYPKDTLSSLIIELFYKNHFILEISELVKLEALKNISLKKANSLPLLENLFRDIAIHKNISPRYDFYPSMPINDRVILCTALSLKCDFFITGNYRDFGHLYHTKVENTLILNQRDFIEKRWEI